MHNIKTSSHWECKSFHASNHKRCTSLQASKHKECISVNRKQRQQIHNIQDTQSQGMHTAQGRDPKWRPTCRTAAAICSKLSATMSAALSEAKVSWSGYDSTARRSRSASVISCKKAPPRYHLFTAQLFALLMRSTQKDRYLSRTTDATIPYSWAPGMITGHSKKPRDQFSINTDHAVQVREGVKPHGVNNQGSP